METMEKTYVERSNEDYAKKGTANTGVALGASGLGVALLALWASHNRRGNGNCEGNINTAQTQAEISYVERKECQDYVELTQKIYQGILKHQEDRYSDKNQIDQQFFDLYKYTNNADFMMYKNMRDNTEVTNTRIALLEAKVEKNEAVLPYQLELVRRDAEFDLFRRTCRMITGEVVLPNTPVVTGFGSYNSCNGCGVRATEQAFSDVAIASKK